MASDWIAAARKELDRLTEPHREKKVATVIAIVDARIGGQSEETVWDRSRFSNVCARSVYHGKWKKNSLFMDVLRKVTELAQGWKDGEELRAIELAARKLRLASPVVADQLVSVATTGRVRRLVDVGNGPQVLYENAAASEILRATLALLDRAGMETAVKTDARIDDGAPRIVIDR
jgi:hypothetical protein